MTPDMSSKTAMATAYLRAAHQLIEPEPRILDDPVAVPILGPGTEEFIRQIRDRFTTLENTVLRSHVVLRSRYAEDKLCEAVKRGAAQYVILGAGFDTFACRQPDWAKSLRIFEVDHPETQAVKRSYIEKSEISIPENVVFAGVDFETESLCDGLKRSGVSFDKPTFFSWLGVTMYLNKPAIRSTLKTLGSFPEKSEIVLTYLSSADNEHPVGTNISDAVTRLGEPFVSFFEPEDMEDELKEAGFKTIEFLSPEQAGKIYYDEGRYSLAIPVRTGIVSAIV